MENEILEKLFNKIVDVLFETLQENIISSRCCTQKSVICIFLSEKRKVDLLERKRTPFIKNI